MSKLLWATLAVATVLMAQPVMAQKTNGPAAGTRTPLQPGMAPEPIHPLKRATVSPAYAWEPKVKEPEQLGDPASWPQSAGRVNPFEFVTLTEPLIFFNPRDQVQLDKAAEIIRKHNGRIKVIMVGYPTSEVFRRWKSTAYVDVRGDMARKLKITAGPALVTQDGKKLRIEELGN